MNWRTTTAITVTVIVLLIMVVGALTYVARMKPIKECEIRFRAAHSVIDSVRVLDTHPFCNQAL